MQRDDIFAIATANGWVAGTRLTAPQRTAIRVAFRTALTADDLADAPAFYYSDHGTDKRRNMTQADAVRAMMEELQ